MGRQGMRWMRVVAVAGALVLGTGAAAQADENQFFTDFGMGMGAAGANLLYIPAKVVYATLGGLTGGFAYGLTGGNMEAARKVWNPSMGGTYVVTPTMLRGEEPVMFSGVNEPKTTEVAQSTGQQFAPSHAENVTASASAPALDEASSEPFQGY